MIALIRLLIAFSPVYSSDIVCSDATDGALCIEQVCRIMSGVDYSVDECDGLAVHVRQHPPCTWDNSCPTAPEDCDTF